MATANFALSGDDPLLSADVLTGGVDPSLVAATDLSAGELPLTPPTNDVTLESLSTSPDTFNTSFTSQGPTLAQLGATTATPGIVGASDPSAANAHPSTAATPGKSTLDSVLGVSKLAASFAQIGIMLAGGSQNPNKPANNIANAKNPATGAGTNVSLVWIGIAIFVAIVVWLELKH
jgi:hypothetical protein